MFCRNVDKIYYIISVGVHTNDEEMVGDQTQPDNNIS